MAAITKGMEWLGQLKASQLHQLAVALGSACSGSKKVIVDGICQTLFPAPPLGDCRAFNGSSLTSRHPRRQLSIVSIDMGIQNLAYANLLVGQVGDRISQNLPSVGSTNLPMLKAWERLNVFPGDSHDNSMKKSAKLGGYLPSRYADAAYYFISDLLRKYDPTHILIEQQRFRSGGGSAVAEWTLRVGVFEGMLHAILQTLQKERKDETKLEAIVSISPARTARFWLEGSQRLASQIVPSKTTGREGKRAKVDIVAKSFLDGESRMVEIGNGQAKATETTFMEKWYATSKVAKELQRPKRTTKRESAATPKTPTQPKLDDLADCLLQALAWLKWQKTRDLVIQDSRADDPLDAIRKRLGELNESTV
ncbi:hypothetical protein GJ744_009391 [Endocarpon pusillum]|uniref:Mitochondrial resolvase Ydc2 catalytic domain-containing protein n=1 Tax=Endocarpon pusillum TaxID=364733 RepID=A0A8H7AJH7_9EURO|nr:hypothetical protein GJ744_009391 [Endocarpon pusillum]